MKTPSPGVLRGILVLSSFQVACGGGDAPEPTSQTGDPESVFLTLENRLVNSETAYIQFHVSAEGAVEVELDGSLRVHADGATELRAEGDFAGETVDLFLRAEAGEYELGNGPNRTVAPTPDHLKEALFVGFTRMGILHNLAMLIGSSPPDGADGGVKEWAVVDSFAFGDQQGEGGSRIVSFSMTVAGIPAGSASLEIDAAGAPLLRRQTVLFPSGEMRVVEEYAAVSIQP
jgi:hypothetical protein